MKNGKRADLAGADGPTRYSDKELEEFRVLLNASLAEAEKDLEILKATLDPKRDNSEPLCQREGEDTLTVEDARQLMSRQEKFIQHLKHAQLRIDNKTYGICRVTGRLISKERLRLVPHATLSIEAKHQIVHEQKDESTGS